MHQRPAQAIDGAPDDGQPLIYRTLLATIALSKTSVHLTTGFFVPTPDLARALITAAQRGVDVQLVVPHESDSSAAVAAGRAGYGELLEAGVHIHERQQRILHAKTAVVDGAWSAVGSSNLDWRSTVWNNEIDAIILGPDFGGQMEAMFRADVKASHTIQLAAWRRRGLGERFRELRAKLVETTLVHFDGLNDGRMFVHLFGPDCTDAAQTQRRPPSPHPEDVVQGAELAGL